mgnify:CR=1 FL=1
MAHRGLYGQTEGNEKRGETALIQDVFRENEIAEGEWERPMVAAAKKGDLKELGRLRESMKSQAVCAGCNILKAQERADSCLRRAMSHLRV